MIDLGPASSNPDAAPVSSDTEIARIAPVLTRSRQMAFPSRSTVINPRRKPMPCRVVWPISMIFAVFQTLRSIRNWRNHLPNSSLCIRCKTGRQIGARHPLATSWITLRRSLTRIAALTGAGIKRNRLVLDPGMGFSGAAPETSLSVLARFDELRLRFDLPVLLSVSRKSFLRAHRPWSGDVGAATLAAELAAAAGGADFIRTRAAPLARRAGGIGGAERNRKNSLTAHSGYFSIFAVQQACPL